MQYPQENYHPLTAEPAAALNDTLTCKTIWGKPYKKLRQYYLIWFNPGVIWNIYVNFVSYAYQILLRVSYMVDDIYRTTVFSGNSG